MSDPQLPAGLTPDQIDRRTLAALRAVCCLVVFLKTTDKKLKAEEEKAKSEATKAYRAVLREADDLGDRISDADTRRILKEACSGLREHDRIRDENKAARKGRKAERKRVDQALAELSKPPTDGQASLPVTTDLTGFAWYTGECVSVIYTALCELDKQGKLDNAQRETMGVLATAGIATVSLVLDPAEAVEQEADPADAADVDNAVASADLPV